jgi:hypothetical protein
MVGKMDDPTIALALQKLNSALPEPAKWMILLKRNGEVLGRIGEYLTYIPPPLKDELVASSTYAHATAEIEMLEGLKHGTFQYSISIGGDGIYFIFHLNDAYWLGISYQWVGVHSFDAVIDGVLGNFQQLLETLNPWAG